MTETRKPTNADLIIDCDADLTRALRPANQSDIPEIQSDITLPESFGPEYWPLHVIAISGTDPRGLAALAQECKNSWDAGGDIFLAIHDDRQGIDEVFRVEGVGQCDGPSDRPHIINLYTRVYVG